MDKTKKQVLPSGLWVVATPIGNLKDISERAIQALDQAEGIFCEDTRETAKLLSALGIAKSFSKLERLDAHSSLKVIARAVERLVAGESFAVVTDAGTPAVSDPGAQLVAQARDAGVQITPIPGSSAVMALLSVCGFNETAFVFRGFFPRKTEERREELERSWAAAQLGVSNVFAWFESPYRILETLEEFVAVLASIAPETKLVAAKELTKLHERIFGGSLSEVLQAVRMEIQKEGTKGEWCFALHYPDSKRESKEDLNWLKALECLIECGVSASEASRTVSQHFGVSKKQVYERFLQNSGKKVNPGY